MKGGIVSQQCIAYNAHNYSKLINIFCFSFYFVDLLRCLRIRKGVAAETADGRSSLLVSFSIFCPRTYLTDTYGKISEKHVPTIHLHRREGTLKFRVHSNSLS
ncbi:unnamed protein product, partial [Nesidiocoris tenuis]